MALKIQEDFVESSLRGNTVFEFGCSPGLFALRIGKDFDVTGIDLYEPETKENYRFIRGDLMTTVGLEEEYYDNVIAVSSLEHSGLEREDFENNNVTCFKDHSVLNKLERLVKPGGRLIVTVPYGGLKTYYVDMKGNSGTPDEIKNPYWGWRTYTLSYLLEMLKSPFEVEKNIVYAYTGKGDYFSNENWKVVEQPQEHNLGLKRRAHLCISLCKL